MPRIVTINQEVASRLREGADLLEQQAANPFRISAYRHAADTALAHELGRTNDRVVIYFYNDHHQEGLHTVVTETRGPLVGKRVVRGQEQESRDYYNIRHFNA